MAIYYFYLLLSPSIVLFHQVDGIGIIVIVAVLWINEVVVRGVYDILWKGEGWFVIVFYGMCHKKSRRGQNSGCQCAYINY